MEQPHDSRLADAKRNRQVGWAFRAIDDAFGFLVSNYGYVVDSVVIHHEGSSCTFRGPRYSVVIQHEDWWGGFIVQVVDMEREPPAAANIWEILSRRDPAGDWAAPTATQTIPRGEATNILQRWAAGLREHGPDLVRGDPAPDIAWRPWW